MVIYLYIEIDRLGNRKNVVNFNNWNIWVRGILEVFLIRKFFKIIYNFNNILI